MYENQIYLKSTLILNLSEKLVSYNFPNIFEILPINFPVSFATLRSNLDLLRKYIALERADKEGRGNSGTEALTVWLSNGILRLEMCPEVEHELCPVRKVLPAHEAVVPIGRRVRRRLVGRGSLRLQVGPRVG